MSEDNRTELISTRRGTGKTHKMMMHVKDDPEVIVLVHSQAFANYLKRVYRAKCTIEAEGHPDKYRGLRPSKIVRDHWTLEKRRQ
ncbi:hypothetical protein EKK58_12090 [Candidatus Dependentiae bacterium]|nr:MAG: hypothetical protein EKK58_12090 [Candidatus Dependentiae bacterium]